MWMDESVVFTCDIEPVRPTVSDETVSRNGNFYSIASKI